MSKGADTKRVILAAGLDMASQLGLENVTIGSLAKQTGLSKSGLYAHFQSKESLQIEILNHAGQLFAGSVIIPALQVKAGIPRIKRLVENWNRWNVDLKGGCIFVAACNDYKDRPGKIRDFVVAQQQEWLGSLQRLAQSAVECGDFQSTADKEQFAFELYSLLLGFHLYYKMLAGDDLRERQDLALNRLLAGYQ